LLVSLTSFSGIENDKSSNANKVVHLGEAKVSLNGQLNAFLWPYAYKLDWPFRVTFASPKWPTVFTVRNIIIIFYFLFLQSRAGNSLVDSSLLVSRSSFLLQLKRHTSHIYYK
jgi:hypothetical protein